MVNEIGLCLITKVVIIYVDKRATLVPDLAVST